MGYEKLSHKLTFYKAFFSPQWKFLIHTILQCLSAKTTAWNEFSSTMASAIICLATNQKFNFSKYIFESRVKNLDNDVKFLMKQKSRRPKEKDTEIPHSSFPSDPTNVADEAVTKEPISSEEASLGDQEDASKQGRKIDDIDDDEDITLENVHDADMFGVNDLDSDEVVVESKVTDKLVKGQGSKDKGKAKMIEPDKPLKKKDQIKFDEEEALRLQAKFDEEDRFAREKAQQVEEANIAWDDIQAKVDADYQLAERLQAQEQ
ncbi:hypothetical protein Tco_1481613 [Tanacetum coccineum]